MKKIIVLILVALGFMSCNNDDDNATTNVNTSFNFTHNWDGTAIANSNFNSIQYTNANGEQLSIELLRYLISDVTFTKQNGETIVIDDYNLIDVTNNANMSFTPNIQIPTGTYSNVSFTFGFDAEDNTDGAYSDLNAANWNVPNIPTLGNVGGYHYMQLEGRFINSGNTETGYQYHTIRAADGNTSPPTILDTFIDVDLGEITITNNISIEVQMNIAEWFKNPNTWDLDVLNSVLMPNYDAQIMMNQNGQNVFSLGTITQ